MNDPAVFENPCPICKKRPATRLCDYVVSYDAEIIWARNEKHFKELNEGTRHETCDLPLCTECRHELNKVDFCPYHWKLLQQSELPDDLKAIRLREKAKTLI